MTIHDSWQDRERERKRRLRAALGKSPAECKASWVAYVNEVIKAEMLGRKLYVTAPPGPLVWSEPQPERWDTAP